MSDTDQTIPFPEYDGKTPVGMVLTLTGGGTRPVTPSKLGERRVMVVEVETDDAGHRKTAKGNVYHERRRILDSWEVLGVEGTRLLNAMRQQARTADDEAAGRTPLATDETDMAVEGWTDGNGVAMSPEDIANIQGSPVAAILGGTPPVVVIYEDNARHTWPTDFAPDTRLPHIGQTIITDDDTPRVVAELLDAETGEPLELGEQLDRVEAPMDDEIDETVAGDIDDDVAPLDDVEDFEAGYPEDGRPDDKVDATAPTEMDFAVIDVTVDDLKDTLAEINDADELRRLANAERIGRKRGDKHLKTRAAALSAIERRLEAVTSGVRLKLVKPAEEAAS